MASEWTWTHELVEQLDWWWTHMFRPRLSGLSDDEYFWEPVPGCWSVRQAGNGGFTVDYQFPELTPPPVTTIAWRLAHIGGPVLGLRANSHFGDGKLSIENLAWPGTAKDAITFVEDSYAVWKAGVAALGDAGLAAKCGPAEGPFSEYPMASLVLHINRETIHHGAEVALLRDLYRDRF